MLSFSYHFTNVQDSFSSSYSYQQTLKFLFSSTYSEFPGIQQSNVLYTSVQSEHQWNTHLYTNLHNHPFISIAHKESSISMQNILYMQSDPL